MVKDTLVAVLPARTSRQALRASGCNVRVFCLFFFNKLVLFIYFGVHWVFVAVHSLFLVVVSRG